MANEIRVKPELPPSELFVEISYWEAYEKRTPIYNMPGRVPDPTQGEKGMRGVNHFLYPGMKMLWQRPKQKPVQGYLVGFNNEATDPLVYMIPSNEQFPHMEWMNSSPWYSQKALISSVKCFSTTYMMDMMMFLSEPAGNGGTSAFTAPSATPAPQMPSLYEVPGAPVMSTYTPSHVTQVITQPTSSPIPRQVQVQMESVIAGLTGDNKAPIGEIIQKLVQEKFENTDLVSDFALRKMRKMPKTIDVEEIKEFYYRLGLFLLRDNATDAMKFLMEEPVVEK